MEEPSEGDIAGAMYSNEQADRALSEARSRGWIDDRADNPDHGDEVVLKRIASMSESGGKGPAGVTRFRQTLVEKHYKRLVDRYLFDLQPHPQVPDADASLPSLIEAWDYGDDPRRIDWTSSVLASGTMAGAVPQQRALEPEPRHPQRRTGARGALFLGPTPGIGVDV